MKNFKRFFLVLFLLFFYIFINAYSYTLAISNNIKNNVFRLHVIANSNSKEDQDLKYKVRDNILKYINSSSKNKSKNEIITFLNENSSTIKKIAQDTIVENGYNYPVNIYIGNFSFPTKTYGDISFPAGYYDALKIEIGNAKGQNWWCVMFPPLCFIDVTSGIVPENSKDLLKENLSNEEYNLLSSNSNDIKIKFKFIEIFQNLNIKIANSK